MFEPRIVLGLFVFVLLNFYNSATPDVRDYSGYKVYVVKPTTMTQLQQLNHITDALRHGIDVWHRSTKLGHSSQILVPPALQDDFTATLRTYSLDYHITISDLGQQIAAAQKPTVGRRIISGQVNFNEYYRPAEINKFLDGYVKKNPTRSKILKVGSSYEGRPMNAIWITNGDGQKKPMIYIDAGIHAREWAAPATALYIIDQLVTQPKKYADVLGPVDWLILPSVNPDGYDYTHTKDRYWRKTRKPSGAGCIGTDPNRNFGFHWAEVGSSYDPCDETYHGDDAFSEVEARVVKNILHNIKDKCIFYLTLHSFGAQLLYPWGWTSDLPDTWRDIHEVATAGQIAIYNATGTEYEVGSSTNVIYPAAGGSDDYALGVCNIPVAITMELPGEDFVLPVELLQEKVEESWLGIREMALTVIDKYV